MSLKLLETKRESNSPLCNTNRNRARGHRLLAELCKLASLRISSREMLDWPAWLYCMAATLCALPSGSELRARFHKNKLLQGMYYDGWPECSVKRILTGGRHAIFRSLEEVPEEIKSDAAAAIERARSSPHFRKGFIPADSIGVFLKVRREEVESLSLRLINGVDFTSADRREKRRQSSSQRMEKNRRLKGSVPLEQYKANTVSKLSPWDALGISRASFYRKPKEERQEIIEKMRLSLAG